MALCRQEQSGVMDAHAADHEGVLPPLQPAARRGPRAASAGPPGLPGSTRRCGWLVCLPPLVQSGMVQLLLFPVTCAVTDVRLLLEILLIICACHAELCVVLRAVLWQVIPAMLCLLGHGLLVLPPLLNSRCVILCTAFPLTVRMVSNSGCAAASSAAPMAVNAASGRS